MTTEAPVLEGRDLTKYFRVKKGRGLLARRVPIHAVDRVSVRLDAGKVTALVGESGAGKTTVGRLLAQIIKPDAGQVLLDGRPAPAGRPRSYAAQVQMVFQDPFASLNPVHRVRHHLIRPLQIHHMAEGGADAAVAELLRRVALKPPDNFTRKFPYELSGGQRQRVALAQALCRSPELLLLDEPFSALDAPVRLELRRELRRLQHDTGLATVLVTHDPEEAAFLSDEVIVISEGRALQSGSTRDLYTRPSSPEVARLLGIANLHRAVVVSDGWIDADGVRIAASTADMSPRTPVLWSIRPERVSLLDSGGLSGTCTDVADLGASVDLFISIAAGLEIQARTTERRGFEIGGRCHIQLPSEAISVWPYEQSGTEEVGRR